MGVWIEIASETELDLNYLDPVMLEQVFLAVKYRFDVGKKSVLTFILHLTSIASRRYRSPSSKMIWKKMSYLTQTCFVDVFVHMWCILSRFLLYWIGVYNILLYHLIQCCRMWNDNVSHVFSYNIVSLNFLLQYYNVLYFDIKDHWLSFSSRWAL